MVNARLSNDGVLTFENAAVDAGIAKPPTAYRASWSRFDNATAATVGAAIESGAEAGSGGKVEARVKLDAPNLLDSPFLRVSVSTIHPEYPAWSSPVTFTFRRAGTQWETVGLDRNVQAVVQK